VYHARDLVEIDDVNTTWECFGQPKFSGKVSKALFASPFFFVTPKVMRIVRAAGVTQFDWAPISVENADGSITGPIPEVLPPESRAKRKSVSDFSPEQQVLLRAEVSAGVAEKERRHEELAKWFRETGGFGTPGAIKTFPFPPKKDS